MSKLTSTTTFAAVMTSALGVVSMSLGASVAAAAPASMSTAMPMTGLLRACDFTALKGEPNPGFARPVAHVGTDGAGNVVATVDIATAQPNTLYGIRVVQTPRPSSGCAAGAPGVISGSLQTDDAGAGHVTVQGPAATGATGAWVSLELPSGLSQTPAEFYTSEFIASI